MKTNDDLDMVKQKMHPCPGKEWLVLMLGVNQKGKNPSMFFVFKHAFEDVMECPDNNKSLFVLSLTLSEITTVEILKMKLESWLPRITTEANRARQPVEISIKQKYRTIQFL